MRIFHPFVHACHPAMEIVVTTNDRFIIAMVAAVHIVEVNTIDIAVSLEVPDDSEERGVAAGSRPGRGRDPVHDHRLPGRDLRNFRSEASGQVGRQDISTADRHYAVFRSKPLSGYPPHTVRDAAWPLSRPEIAELPIPATHLDLGPSDRGPQCDPQLALKRSSRLMPAAIRRWQVRGTTVRSIVIVILPPVSSVVSGPTCVSSEPQLARQTLVSGCIRWVQGVSCDGAQRIPVARLLRRRPSPQTRPTRRRAIPPLRCGRTPDKRPIKLRGQGRG